MSANIPHSIGTIISATDTATQALETELQEVGAERFTARDYRPGVVRHIVLFRYAPGVSDAEKAEVQRLFLALQSSLRHDGRPYIVSIVAGPQSNGEGAHHDFEQGFIVTFDSQGDRNYYVGRPLVDDPQFFDAMHDEFKAHVGQHLLPGPDGVLVFDFVETPA
ncbi:MAG: Dabb family protein [Mycetocola sp.]